MIKFTIATILLSIPIGLLILSNIDNSGWDGKELALGWLMFSILFICLVIGIKLMFL